MTIAPLAWWTITLIRTPHVTPPGNVWDTGDTIGLLILLCSATAAGWLGMRHGLMTLGVLAAAATHDVFLPDGREMLSIAAGRASLSSYLAAYVAFMFAAALVCRLTGWIGFRARRMFAPSAPATPLRCRRCGYDLWALAERRCPECGTPFAIEDSDAVRQSR